MTAMNFLDWLGLTQAHASVNVGDPAPDAASRDQNGQPVRLADLYGDGPTLIYFYPKADTPGCTAQACSLRGGFAELQDRGVRVIGVSSDSPRRAKTLRRKIPASLHPPRRRGHAIANAFGVRLLLGMTHRHPSSSRIAASSGAISALPPASRRAMFWRF